MPFVCFVSPLCWSGIEMNASTGWLLLQRSCRHMVFTEELIYISFCLIKVGLDLCTCVYWRFFLDQFETSVGAQTNHRSLYFAEIRSGLVTGIHPALFTKSFFISFPFFYVSFTLFPLVEERWDHCSQFNVKLSYCLPVQHMSQLPIKKSKLSSKLIKLYRQERSGAWTKQSERPLHRCTVYTDFIIWKYSLDFQVVFFFLNLC